MFKNLTDFAYKRSGKEALGFYLGYLILIVVVGALAGGLFGLASGQENFELGLRIGNIIGILASLGLSFAVLSKKGLMNNFGLLLLALLSGLLAFIGGGLLGLIPASYLTTKLKVGLDSPKIQRRRGKSGF